MNRDDIPIKDVTSDEDVIMNLSWENSNYHRALFDLFTLVRNLKFGKKLLDESNIDIEDFTRIMNTARNLLGGDENYN